MEAVSEEGPVRDWRSRRLGDMAKTQPSAARPGSGSKRKRRPRNVWNLLAIAAAVGAAAGGMSWWWRPAAPATVDVSAEDPSDLSEPQVVNPGYLGPHACAACHSDRVSEFLETNHFRTFRVPEAKAMPVGFASANGTFDAYESGLRFEMTRSGSGYFQTAIRTTPGGEKRTTSRIDLVLGAGGKADDVYLTWHGDRLYELPMAWLFTSNQWGASHFSLNGSPEGSRELTLRCLECHNTWFAHVPGTLNQYKPDSFIMGVTCEKCHGPGREHVAFHQAHLDAESGERIVKPV